MGNDKQIFDLIDDFEQKKNQCKSATTINCESFYKV